jgi:hypothetical protein
MLSPNDLTFATLIRTRASALTTGSALKSSMTSDNFLFRFWPWALSAPEARRHAENRGSIQKYAQVRLAALDIIPAHNAFPALFASRNRVGEVVATAIRTLALFIARTNFSTPRRNGKPPDAGYSACSCNGKTSSTRMSTTKCSSLIRAASGAAGTAAAAAARVGCAAGGGDERKRGRRVPRLRAREGQRMRFAKQDFVLVSRNGDSRSPLINAAFSRKLSIRRRLPTSGFRCRPWRPTEQGR